VGEFLTGLDEIHAEALIGMNVFVGLRFAIWGEGNRTPEEVAATVNDMLANGIARKSQS